MALLKQLKTNHAAAIKTVNMRMVQVSIAALKPTGRDVPRVRLGNVRLPLIPSPKGVCVDLGGLH